MYVEIYLTRRLQQKSPPPPRDAPKRSNTFVMHFNFAIHTGMHVVPGFLSEASILVHEQCDMNWFHAEIEELAANDFCKNLDTSC